MKFLKLFIVLLASTALNGFCATPEAQRNIPYISKIRGFNYESAQTIGHNEMWLQYSSAEPARDMDYAYRLNPQAFHYWYQAQRILTRK